MERQNFSFPPETRMQLVALAENVERYGGNQSEVVRVAIDFLYRHHFFPDSTAPDALLERVDLLAMQIRSAVAAEFEKRAELAE